MRFALGRFASCGAMLHTEAIVRSNPVVPSVAVVLGKANMRRMTIEGRRTWGYPTANQPFARFVLPEAWRRLAASGSLCEP